MQFLSRNDRLSRPIRRASSSRAIRESSEHALLGRWPGSRFRLHGLRRRREWVAFEFREPRGFRTMPVPDVRALHRGLPAIWVARVGSVRLTAESFHGLDPIASTLQRDDPPAGRPLGDQFVAVIRRAQPGEGILAACEQENGGEQREEAKGVHGAEDGKRGSQAQATSRPAIGLLHFH